VSLVIVTTSLFFPKLVFTYARQINNGNYPRTYSSLITETSEYETP